MTAYDIPLVAPPGLQFLLDPLPTPVVDVVNLIISIFFGG